MIYLLSGINCTYLTKAERFIRSMPPSNQISNIIITLDFSADASLKQKYGHIRFVELDSNRVRAKNSNSCLQHGGFLDALDWVGDEEVIIFTDADIDIQRSMNPDEISFFSGLAENEIAVGYNASPLQTLKEEARALLPLENDEAIEACFPGFATLKVYNTGVVAAKKKTYKALYEHYVREWDKADRLFAHYAKQQWLLSYLIQSYFKVKLIPNSIHSHAHHPVTLRIEEPCGFKFCIGNQPVLFAHAFHHVPDDGSLAPQDLARIPSYRSLMRRYRRWKRSAVLLLICLIVLGGLTICFLMKHYPVTI
jgi:hypothetical protein